MFEMPSKNDEVSSNSNSNMTSIDANSNVIENASPGFIIGNSILFD